MKKKTLKKSISFLVSLLMLLNTSLVVLGAEKVVDAKMYWSDDFTSWNDTENSGTIFDIADFEPGTEEIKYIKVENAGDLAFSYALNFVSEQDTSLADAIDVYASDAINGTKTIADMTSIGTLKDVINGNSVSTGKILPNDLTGDDFYTNETVIAIALKMKDNASVDYMDKTIADFEIQLTATECEYDGYPSVDKFEVKLPEADFLYRVGNENDVLLSSLFKAIDGADIGNVTATVTSLDETSSAEGIFNSNADWTKASIDFNGTGPVKVTIDDDDFANELSLNLEVIDATNTTTTTNAENKDIVLLNDINGAFNVYNGHTVYGNGFTVNTGNTYAATLKSGYIGRINLNNGNLDNVKIVGPVYPVANIYQSQADDEANNVSKYFYNTVIINGGTNTITNSYISGSRTALCVKSADVVKLENTTLSGGAYANLEVRGGQEVILKDVTTIQNEEENTFGEKDSSGNTKKIMGMGIGVTTDSTKVIIEGFLKQYNWLNKTQWDAVIPSAYQSAFPKLFTDSTFESYRHYRELESDPYVNTGLIFMCDWNNGINLEDNRTDKTLTYTKTNVNLATLAGGVYSITNAGTLTDALYISPEYISTIQKAAAPKATFDYTTLNNIPSDGTSNDYCYYDSVSHKYQISFDEGESFTWDGKILTLTKGTKTLDYTMSVSEGASVNQNKTITFDTAGDYVVTYTYQDTENYRLNNGAIEKYSVTYTKNVNITVYEIEPEAVPTEFDFLGKGYRTEVAGGNVYAMPNVTETINSNTNGIRSVVVDGVTIYYPVVSMHKSGTSSWYNYFSVFEGVTIKDCDQTTVYNTSTTTMPSGLEVIGGFILNASGNVSTAESANGTAIFNYATGKEIKCKTYSSYGLCYYPDSEFTKSTNSRDEQTIVAKYRYTDSNGASYYYYVGYWCAKHTKQSCVTGDTLVTLSDGSQKRIDEVTYDDELLVWDFEKGDYAVTSSAVVRNHGFADNNVITLKFSDGTITKVVNEHGYYNSDLNKFVLFSEETADDYIGQKFAKTNGNEVTKVKLVDCIVEQQYIESYSLLSAYHYNFITDNILSLSSSVGGLEYFMPFEYDDNMKIDAEKKQADIEKYGLFTYEDFEDRLTKEQFEVLNMPQMKVSVGKGIITLIELYKIIDIEVLEKNTTYNNAEVYDSPAAEELITMSVTEEPAIMLLSDIAENVKSDIITSTSNKIKTASYAVESAVENNVITLSATGTASTGYAKITVDGESFYTIQIPQSESISVTLKNTENAKDLTVTVESFWGNSANYDISQDGLLANDSEIDFGTFTLTVSGASAILSNTTKYPVTGDVYLAVYEGSTLVGVKKQNITVEGKNSYTYSPEITVPENATIKAFIWETESMKPIL